VAYLTPLLKAFFYEMKWRSGSKRWRRVPQVV